MLKAVWLSSAMMLSVLTYDLVPRLTYDSPAQSGVTVEPGLNAGCLVTAHALIFRNPPVTGPAHLRCRIRSSK